MHLPLPHDLRQPLTTPPWSRAALRPVAVKSAWIAPSDANVEEWVMLWFVYLARMFEDLDEPTVMATSVLAPATFPGLRLCSAQVDQSLSPRHLRALLKADTWTPCVANPGWGGPPSREPRGGRGFAPAGGPCHPSLSPPSSSLTRMALWCLLPHLIVCVWRACAGVHWRRRTPAW